MAELMNREFYKLRILEQLTDKKSPLRYILTGNRWGYRDGTNRVFNCKALDLMVICEPYSDENYNFRLVDIDLTNESKINDISTGSVLFAFKHVFDVIKFERNKIVFTYQKAFLENHDYEFRLKEDTSHCHQVVFDTKRMRFTNESDFEKAKDFLALCVSTRKEGNAFYHSYPFHHFKYSYLDTLEFPSDMSFEEIDAFKNIFRKFKTDQLHSMTTMMRLVSKIDEFCMKYRKDYS